MLIRVDNNYQRAKNGTKAWAVRGDSGAVQDAWFDENWLPEGSQLLVVPHFGYGPHNRNPEVLFVYPRHIILRINPRARGAAAAINRRRGEEAADDAA